MRMMNPIAQDLNEILGNANPHLMDMLSSVGRHLFFPKGILTQGAEAKEKAHLMNATIGIATDADGIMHLPSVMAEIPNMKPESSITYAPSYGLQDLRTAWQRAIREKNPSLGDCPVSLPVVTSGITHAVSVFADLWVDPGDTVILPYMMWGNYRMILSVRKGAEIVTYPIFTEDFKYNLDAFEGTIRKQAAQGGKIIVILNFPHNPSGYTATREEGQRMADILVDVASQGTNVIAAMDDSYFGLFYEEETLKESPFALLCGRHPRLLAVKMDGATKENFVWGLRVGFLTYAAAFTGDAAVAYDALERKTAGCVRGSISNASNIGQALVLKLMQKSSYAFEKAEKFQVLNARAKRVKEVLSDPKYAEVWDVYPFNSGYFMCLRMRNVNAEALRVHLLEKYGVGLISLGERNLRVAFSCLEERQIPELFDLVYKGALELA